jgi:hypothetical protein
MFDESDDGRSVEDRVDDGLEELFERGVLDGDNRTLSNLIRRNQPVEVVASFSMKDVPIREGLLDPEEPGRVLLTYRPKDYKLKPKRERQADGSMNVIGWQLAHSTEGLFAEPAPVSTDLLLREFERLLGMDGQEAMRAADQITERATKWMRDGERSAT